MWERRRRLTGYHSVGRMRLPAFSSSQAKGDAEICARQASLHLIQLRLVSHWGGLSRRISFVRDVGSSSQNTMVRTARSFSSYVSGCLALYLLVGRSLGHNTSCFPYM